MKMFGILQTIVCCLLALSTTAWLCGALYYKCDLIYVLGAALLCAASWGLFNLSLKETED